MNDNTYHVGWVVCLLVCGSRLGVWSFLRWSSTSRIGVCILAAARMRDCLCIPPRQTSTDHSLPYFNSGLPQQRRPPRRRHANQPGSKRPQCMEGILALILKVHDWIFTSLLLNSSLYDFFCFVFKIITKTVCPYEKHHLIYVHMGIKPPKVNILLPFSSCITGSKPKGMGG